MDLPKIKKIKVKFHRTFCGTIKTCTIKKTATNKYYVSILVETQEAKPIPTTVQAEQLVGIDLGIKSLLITSHNEIFPNHQFLKNNLKKLKRQQRVFSRKNKGSNNQKKAKRRLSQLHEKIAHQRLDCIHQASAKLVFKNHATSFAIEDLNIKGMMKHPKLARSISDCGFGIFQSQLIYKSIWMGKNVIKINRWVPSSKRCSQCHHIKPELKLSERTYHCASCGLTLDRDLNAANNLKLFALEQLGLDRPKVKPVDHALTGVTKNNLVIHELKQEAPTRTSVAV